MTDEEGGELGVFRGEGGRPGSGCCIGGPPGFGGRWGAVGALALHVEAVFVPAQEEVGHVRCRTDAHGSATGLRMRSRHRG